MQNPSSNNKNDFLSKKEAEFESALISLRKIFHQALARRCGLSNPDPKYLHKLLKTEKDETRVAKEIRNNLYINSKGFLGKFSELIKKFFRKR